MKKIKIFLVLFLFAASLNAQRFLEQVSSATPDFEAVRESFENYWENKTPGKGEGFKPYKRWEWFWGQRLMPDGSLPPSTVFYDAVNDFWSKHPQFKQQNLTNSSWTFRGPYLSNSGYYGVGRVNCIAFHPTDPNTFWIGAPAGGLWKTTDNGSTWTCNTDQLPVLGVSDIAIDPTNPSIMYLATGDADGSDTYSMGVLKTTDGGNTWNPSGLWWSSLKLIKRLLINPSNPSILLAFASDGLYRTTNGGSTWTNVRAGNYTDAEFKPGNPSIIYASEIVGGSEAQMIRSTDGGANWTPSGFLTGARRVNIAVTPANPDLVDVLGANSGGGLAGMWRSLNSGSNYSQYFIAGANSNFLSSNAGATGTSGQGNYDLAYAIDPANESNIWLGGINTWTTSNGGVSWTLKTHWTSGGGAPVVHADKHNLVFHPLVPNMLFDCNDGGLYRTYVDGAGWEDLSAGLGISQIYRISVSATVNNKVICGLQDNSTKLTSGGNWYDIHATGDGMDNIISHGNANIMFSSSYNGSISRTTNNGSSWTTIASRGGTGINSTSAWVTPYIMHPTDPNTILVGKQQVYKSSDLGNNWEQMGTLGAQNLLAMAYAPSNPNIIYVVTSSSVFKSVDGGQGWAPVYSGAGTLTSISVHATDPDKVWITRSTYGTSGRVLRSTDGGASWQDISGNLPSLPANCIVFQNGSNDGIYVGTDMGVFYRDASMSSWIPFMNGFPNVPVQDLEISYSDGKIWAATYGRGLWNSNLFDASGCNSPSSPQSNGDQSACEGSGPLTLSVTSEPGTEIDWYATHTGGTPLLEGSNTFTTSSAGSYYAAARNISDGCASFARTEVKAIYIQLPQQPVISQVSGYLQSSAASGNQWYLDGTAIPGAVGQYHQPLVSGIYSVQVTQGGCQSPMSAGLNFVMSSINSPELDRNIMVAPNPVSNILQIRYSGAPARFSLQLMDIAGRQLASGAFTSAFDIDMSRYAPGSYVVRITNDRTGEHVQRLVIRN